MLRWLQVGDEPPRYGFPFCNPLVNEEEIPKQVRDDSMIVFVKCIDLQNILVYTCLQVNLLPLLAHYYVPKKTSYIHHLHYSTARYLYNTQLFGVAD